MIWNILMALSVLAASVAGISAIAKKAGATGLYVTAAYIALVLVVQFMRRKPA